ncbi:hypothetical protein D3C71_1793420 [compost metagenome]
MIDADPFAVGDVHTLVAIVQQQANWHFIGQFAGQHFAAVRIQRKHPVTAAALHVVTLKVGIAVVVAVDPLIHP